MILLDTNVLSALMRSEPDPAVLEWLDVQPSPSIWTTSITVFEVRTGLDLLSPSRRRRSLEEAFEQVLESDLDGRVLVFDVPAARAAGALVAERQLIGRTIEVRDAQIAGIARAHRAMVATRNTRHFQDLGLSIVDPWS